MRIRSVLDGSRENPDLGPPDTLASSRCRIGNPSPEDMLDQLAAYPLLLGTGSWWWWWSEGGGFQGHRMVDLAKRTNLGSNFLPPRGLWVLAQPRSQPEDGAEGHQREAPATNIWLVMLFEQASLNQEPRARRGEALDDSQRGRSSWHCSGGNVL